MPKTLTGKEPFVSTDQESFDRHYRPYSDVFNKQFLATNCLKLLQMQFYCIYQLNVLLLHSFTNKIKEILLSYNKVYYDFFFKLPLAIKYMDAKQIPIPAAEAIMHDLKTDV